MASASPLSPSVPALAPVSTSFGPGPAHSGGAGTGGGPFADLLSAGLAPATGAEAVGTDGAGLPVGGEPLPAEGEAVAGQTEPVAAQAATEAAVNERVEGAAKGDEADKAEEAEADAADEAATASEADPAPEVDAGLIEATVPAVPPVAAGAAFGTEPAVARGGAVENGGTPPGADQAAEQALAHADALSGVPGEGLATAGEGGATTPAQADEPAGVRRLAEAQGRAEAGEPAEDPSASEAAGGQRGPDAAEAAASPRGGEDQPDVPSPVGAQVAVPPQAEAGPAGDASEDEAEGTAATAAVDDHRAEGAGVAAAAPVGGEPRPAAAEPATREGGAPARATGGAAAVATAAAVDAPASDAEGGRPGAEGQGREGRAREEALPPGGGAIAEAKGYQFENPFKALGTAAAAGTAAPPAPPSYGQLQQAYQGSATGAVTLALPERVGSDGWGTGVSQRIAWMAHQQLGRAELRLDPPELGSLHVRLTLSQDQASLNFTSPHAHVREALEQQLPRLREMLAENGIALQHSSVSDHSAGRDTARGQGDTRASSGPDQPVDEADTGIAQALSKPLSLVDYYA